MGYTRTLIGKMAMGHLGDRDIGDINDIYDKDAVTLKTRYEHARDLTFVSHDWFWARRSAELQQIPTVPTVKFTLTYALPPNYVRLSNAAEDSAMRLVLDDGDFDITDGVLITDASFVFMQYVANDWSEAVWPAHFAEAMALKLAEVCCLKITHNESMKQLLGKQFNEQAMPNARSIDSTSQPFQRRLVRSPWQESRVGRFRISNLRRI